MSQVKYEVRNLLIGDADGEHSCSLWRIDTDGAESHVAEFWSFDSGFQTKIEYTDRDNTDRQAIVQECDLRTGELETIAGSQNRADFAKYTIENWGAKEDEDCFDYPDTHDMVQRLVRKAKNEFNRGEFRNILRAKRIINFDVKIESVPLEVAIFEREKRVNISYDGSQWQGFTLSREEAKKVIAKLEEAFDL